MAASSRCRSVRWRTAAGSRSTRTSPSGGAPRPRSRISRAMICLTNLPNRVLFREHLEEAVCQARSPGAVARSSASTSITSRRSTTRSAIRSATSCSSSSPPPAVASLQSGGHGGAHRRRRVRDRAECGRRAPSSAASSPRASSRSIGRPYEVDGRHIDIGTSVGIAIAPNDGADPDQLLKNADMALYLAKSDGRGTHRFFEREMDRRLQARHALEIDLRAGHRQGRVRAALPADHVASATAG